MRWRLLDLFQSQAFQTAAEYAAARAALQSYLAGGQAAAYQLSGQLADTFDQYLVYRPQWISAWQQGRLLGLGEDEDLAGRIVAFFLMTAAATRRTVWPCGSSFWPH